MRCQQTMRSAGGLQYHDGLRHEYIARHCGARCKIGNARRGVHGHRRYSRIRGCVFLTIGWGIGSAPHVQVSSIERIIYIPGPSWVAVSPTAHSPPYIPVDTRIRDRSATSCQSCGRTQYTAARVRVSSEGPPSINTKKPTVWQV